MRLKSTCDLQIVQIFGLLLLVPALSWGAGDPILTQAQGEVMILSSPQKEPHADVPKGYVRSKFEGQHYLTKKASVGDLLPLQAWLRTFPGGRARLIYPNGDQVNVGPGSFFKLETGSMKMDHGMIRAIISKTGPRNHFKVRTPSAVMGVRGTDFIVETVGKNLAEKPQTSLTLIRGSVALQSDGVKEAKEVTTGQTAVAEVKKAPETFQTSKIELKRALVLTEKTEKASSDQVPEAIQKLEAQAKSTTVQDMVQYAKTPEEKANLEKIASQSADVQALNSAVVQMQVAKAPEESPGAKRILEEIKKETKRTELELKDLEKSPYEKYFDSTQTE